MIGLECPKPGISAFHKTPESLPAAASAFQVVGVSTSWRTERNELRLIAGYCQAVIIWSEDNLLLHTT
jgi:hypothetical protein